MSALLKGVRTTESDELALLGDVDSRIATAVAAIPDTSDAVAAQLDRLDTLGTQRVWAVGTLNPIASEYPLAAEAGAFAVSVGAKATDTIKRTTPRGKVWTGIVTQTGTVESWGPVESPPLYIDEVTFGDALPAENETSEGFVFEHLTADGDTHTYGVAPDGTHVRVGAPDVGARIAETFDAANETDAVSGAQVAQEIAAERARIDALEAGQNTALVGTLHATRQAALASENLFAHPTLEGGEFPRRSNSAIVDTSVFSDRGYSRAMQWRASGNEFMIAPVPSAPAGRKLFSAFLVQSDSGASELTAGVTYQRDSAGGLTGLQSGTTGFVRITPTVIVVWTFGTVSREDTVDVAVGSAIAPVGSARFAVAPFAAFISSAAAVHETLARYLHAYVPTTATITARPAVIRPKAALVITAPGRTDSRVIGTLHGKRVSRTMVPTSPTSLTSSSVFNFREDSIDGVTFRSGGDDVAPYRALGATIGANHGYRMAECAASAHGKTAADVGAVYSDGTDEYVLVGIGSDSIVYLTRRSDNAAIPTGTFTHVSGGSSTTDIVVTAAPYEQLYPAFKARTIKCFVDGVEVSAETGVQGYEKEVKFVEHYEVLAKPTLIAWIESASPTVGAEPVGQAAFSVDIEYVFGVDAQCTIYSTFTARDTMELQDIMFLQAASLSETATAYIPKTLPIDHEGTTYDLSAGAAIDSSSWSSRLDVVPASWVAGSSPPDRIITRENGRGFATGYLPVDSADPAVRPTLASVKAAQISTSGKFYLSAIDQGSQTLSNGDTFAVIGYRHLLVDTPTATARYVVEGRQAAYLYLTWTGPGRRVVPVPSSLVGRSASVVEKSDAVTVSADSLSANLTVDVDGVAAGVGTYLVLSVSR